MPDYLGAAVHRAGEVAYDELRNGNAERFTKTFGPFFLGSFAIKDDLCFAIQP